MNDAQKTDNPILWWAVSRYETPDELLEYFPGVDEYEARQRAALKHEGKPNQFFAVEAIAETCSRCHVGFLLLHSGGLYTHCYCERCLRFHAQTHRTDSIGVVHCLVNPCAFHNW